MRIFSLTTIQKIIIGMLVVGGLVGAGVYFGFPPQIEKAEISSVQKDAFRVKVDYGGNTTEDDSLFLLAIIRDENNKECGFVNFDLGQKWPREFAVGNAGLCDDKVNLTAAIGAKIQGKHLSVFREGWK